MLRFLLGRGREKVFKGAEGSRAYAIGDVHGCLDLLQSILRQVREDDAARGPAKTYLIFLGDLVDRGPDSKGVLELCTSGELDWARTIFLHGNHEEFFARVLNGEDEIIPRWLTYGGLECARSYGISGGLLLNGRAEEIGDKLRAAVPARHKAFLDNMADTFRFGDYLFVHAGIRPGIPLDEQESSDTRWIRQGFLDGTTDHGVLVVHGHTIVEEVEQHKNRIALDTGAYQSGLLSAMGFEGLERWCLSASKSPLERAA